MSNNDRWLASEAWDLTWEGEPVTRVDQLISLGKLRFAGTDEEVLKQVSRLPVFEKAPNSLTRSVMREIGDRTLVTGGKKRTIRARPLAAKTSRVGSGRNAIFKAFDSPLPNKTIGIGYATAYPGSGDYIRVQKLSQAPGDREAELQSVVDRLDSEHPGLLEGSGVKSILFTSEAGAPPNMAGAYIPDNGQVRVLMRIALPDRDGRTKVFDRTPERMFYTLVHELAHAIGDGEKTAELYGAVVGEDPIGWLNSLNPYRAKRWVGGVAKYKAARPGGGQDAFNELFADAFTHYLLAGSTDSEKLDNWVEAVAETKGIKELVKKVRVARKVAGNFSSGYPVSHSDIDEFYADSKQEAGEGLAPDELFRIVAMYNGNYQT